MRQIVIHCQYSVPASSQACGGPLAGIERLRLLCAFPASPFTDAMRDFRVGLLNLCRYLTGWSFPLKPLQKSKSGFTQGFYSSVAAVLHERSKAEEFCNVRQRL